MSKYVYLDLEKEFLKYEEYKSIEGNLLKSVIISKIKSLDEKTMSIILGFPELKNKFTKKLNDIVLLDQQSLLSFFQSREFINNSFTEYTNKIGLTNGLKFLDNSDEVVLDFPYKDCILLGNQSREENEGVRQKFFHEVINFQEIDRLFTKKVLCNFQKHTKDGILQINDFKETENLIIKGNNLIALHTIKEKFVGKVKLIYIDPPYNTESLKFAYNDKFDQATWLTFMKNRLDIAKNLLSEDGVIVVEIDYNQSAYLRVLMDDVFGKENYINTISVKSSTPSGVKTAHINKTILKTQHSIICYKKNNLYINPQYVKKDKWDTHYSFFMKEINGELIIHSLVDVLRENNIITKEQSLKDFNINNKKHKEFYIKNGDFIVRKSSYDNQEIKDFCKNHKDKIISLNNLLYYNNDMLQPISKSFQEVLVGTSIETDISNVLCDFWDDIDYQNTQNQGGVSFPAGKKPEQLLYRIISMFTKENDIVLDYHLGSGTTCAVAHKMGRQYIGIEQLEYGSNDSIVRLDNVIKGEQSGMSSSLKWQGGGEFVSIQLYSIVEEVLDLIKKAQTQPEIDTIISLLLSESYFYYLGINENKISYEEIFVSDEFKKLSIEKQKQILHASIDKNNLYVDFNDLHDNNVNLSNEEKKLNEKFYKDNK